MHIGLTIPRNFVKINYRKIERNDFMDIKAKIEEVVNKVKSDKNFAEKFKSDPVKAVEEVLGVDLPDDVVNNVVNGVKAKIDIGNLKDGIGSLFGKK